METYLNKLNRFDKINLVFLTALFIGYIASGNTFEAFNGGVLAFLVLTLSGIFICMPIAAFMRWSRDNLR